MDIESQQLCSRVAGKDARIAVTLCPMFRAAEGAVGTGEIQLLYRILRRILKVNAARNS